MSEPAVLDLAAIRERIGTTTLIGWQRGSRNEETLALCDALERCRAERDHLEHINAQQAKTLRRLSDIIERRGWEK